MHVHAHVPGFIITTVIGPQAANRLHLIQKLSFAHGVLLLVTIRCVLRCRARLISYSKSDCSPSCNTPSS